MFRFAVKKFECKGTLYTALVELKKMINLGEGQITNQTYNNLVNYLNECPDMNETYARLTSTNENMRDLFQDYGTNHRGNVTKISVYEPFRERTLTIRFDIKTMNQNENAKYISSSKMKDFVLQDYNVDDNFITNAYHNDIMAKYFIRITNEREYIIDNTNWQYYIESATNVYLDYPNRMNNISIFSLYKNIDLLDIYLVDQHNNRILPEYYIREISMSRIEYIILVVTFRVLYNVSSREITNFLRNLQTEKGEDFTFDIIMRLLQDFITIGLNIKYKNLAGYTMYNGLDKNTEYIINNSYKNLLCNSVISFELSDMKLFYDYREFVKYIKFINDNNITNFILYNSDITDILMNLFSYLLNNENSLKQKHNNFFNSVYYLTKEIKYSNFNYNSNTHPEIDIYQDGEDIETNKVLTFQDSLKRIMNVKKQVINEDNQIKINQIYNLGSLDQIRIGTNIYHNETIENNPYNTDIYNYPNEIIRSIVNNRDRIGTDLYNIIFELIDIRYVDSIYTDIHYDRVDALLDYLRTNLHYTINFTTTDFIRYIFIKSLKEGRNYKIPIRPNPELPEERDIILDFYYDIRPVTRPPPPLPPRTPPRPPYTDITSSVIPPIPAPRPPPADILALTLPIPPPTAPRPSPADMLILAPSYMTSSVIPPVPAPETAIIATTNKYYFINNIL
jgi:hypothetical protein